MRNVAIICAVLPLALGCGAEPSKVQPSNKTATLFVPGMNQQFEIL